MQEKACVCWWGLRVWVDVKFELEAQFSRPEGLIAEVVKLDSNHFSGVVQLFVQVPFGLQGLCSYTPAHLAKASSSVVWSDS